LPRSGVMRCQVPLTCHGHANKREVYINHDEALFIVAIECHSAALEYI
jgi:hypothetical protein